MFVHRWYRMQSSVNAAVRVKPNKNNVKCNSWIQVISFRTSPSNLMPKKKQRGVSKEAESTSMGAKSDTEPVHQNKDGTVTVNILVKPGARQNAITDISEGSVGVQISAPPIDGEANAELVKFISKTLGVRKSDVVLEKGSKSRSKTLVIHGKGEEEVLALIRNRIQRD